MGTHSSIGQDVSTLRRWAKRSANSLYMRRPKVTSYIFCYAGMSGTSLATALALEYGALDKKFGMLYVRKKGEKSHGRAVESSIGNLYKKAMLVFVDDFSDSGETRNRVIRIARKYVKDEITEEVPTEFYQVFQNNTVHLKHKLPAAC